MYFLRLLCEVLFGLAFLFRVVNYDLQDVYVIIELSSKNNHTRFQDRFILYDLDECM